MTVELLEGLTIPTGAPRVNRRAVDDRDNRGARRALDDHSPPTVRMNTTPPGFFVSAPATPDSDDWVNALDTNAYGVRLLTLPKALELASSGACGGWYISPFAVKWTVGRRSTSGKRYHVVTNGEPIRFDSVGEAFQFVGGVLKLGAAPQVALDVPALPPSSARVTGRLPRSL